MKIRVLMQTAAGALLVGVGVMVFGLVFGTTSTYALWTDVATTSPQNINAGRVSLTATERNPQTDAAAGVGTMQPNGDVSVMLPARVLANLAPNAPQAVLLDLRAISEGHRGLNYSMPVSTPGHNRVVGDNGLAGVMTMVMSAVVAEARQGCLPGALDVGQILYEGPLVGATVPPRQIVDAAYATTTGAEYLCLQFSLPPDYGVYRNEGTVTGTSLKGDVEASTHWYGVVTPSPAARAAEINLLFTRATFRP